MSALLVSVAALGESRLAAQATDKSEPVKINTADGVKLNALFYPGKKTSATVIMLHPLGEGKNINKIEGWKDLGEALQKEGYSVLMFDFRGHGGSTTVEPAEFWSFATNVKGVLKSNDKETLDVKQFIKSPGYLPFLVNDIAAVKAFLDRKHDAGICDTANTVVIGAEDGGTLGAIWINSEWYRYKATVNMFNQIQAEKRAEGNDIISAVFLSIKPSLGLRVVNPSNVLKLACKDHAMPALFFYGAKDLKGKEVATAADKVLKVAKSKKHAYIGAVAVPDTNLVGAKLLKPSLNVAGSIVEYLEKTTNDRKNESEPRNFQESIYIWRNPQTGRSDVAKRKTDKGFKFESYEKFIP